MGVSNQSTKVIVQGNGAQAIFSYSFLIPYNGSYVLIYTDASGNSTVLDQSTYTVAGIGNPNGGMFTYPIGGGAPIASGTSLTFARQDSYTQDTNFTNQNGYQPEVLQSALDIMTLQTQQLAENVSRAIQVPITETYSPVLPGSTADVEAPAPA